MKAVNNPALTALLDIVCIGKEDGVRWRSLTEEHARDSFENLLFSVCRFRELTGTYPLNITVSPLILGSPLFGRGKVGLSNIVS